MLALFGLGGRAVVMGQTFLGYGVDANIPFVVTSNTTVGIAHCQGTILAGTGSTGQFTLTLPAVTGFPSNCSVQLIKNGDSANVARQNLVGIPAHVDDNALAETIHRREDRQWGLAFVL